MKTLNTNIDRINLITKGLNQFSKSNQVESKTDSKIIDIVESTISLCKEKFKNSDIELKVQIDDNFTFECQPTSISQILLNLLNNSFDEIVDKPESWVSISSQINHDTISIIVVDSGDGIDKEVEEKMFLPFFTTKQPGNGTGIGLSIASRMAEDHGGELSYGLVEGHTAFILKLPVE
jgi:C4-dicarboxylate-specific signal transduction histidine kinase